MDKLPVHDDMTITKGKNNKFHKTSVRKNESNIKIAASCIMKEKSTIRGDLGSITIGNFVTLEKGVEVRPALVKKGGSKSYTPATIGANTVIGENTITQAVVIGECVDIGKNCFLGAGCVIKDCVLINDNSVVHAAAIIPSCTIVDGESEVVGDTNENFEEIMKKKAAERYRKYVQTFAT